MFCILEEVVKKSAKVLFTSCVELIILMFKTEFICKELHNEVSFIAVHIHKIDHIIVCIIASHSAHNNDR